VPDKFAAKMTLIAQAEQITQKPLIITESGISMLGVDSTLKALPAGWPETLAAHQQELWQTHDAQAREVFFFSSSDVTDQPDLNSKGLCRRDGTRGPGFFAIWSHVHPSPAPPPTQAYKPVASSGAPAPTA
jgi:hypothetical protein